VEKQEVKKFKDFLELCRKVAYNLNNMPATPLTLGQCVYLAGFFYGRIVNEVHKTPFDI